MRDSDKLYCGIPWKDGGRTREEGLDCKGLAELFLSEQFGFVPMRARTPAGEMAQHRMAEEFVPAMRPEKERGDIVFFRRKTTGQITHVAVYLGEDKYLHIVRGGTSRIENGLTLIRRIGLEPVGAIGVGEAEQIGAALEDKKLGDVLTIVLIVVSIILSLVSSFLMPKPKLGSKQRPDYGRYGFNALITQNNPELPLADILGKVSVAGNSPYQTPLDKSDPSITPSAQKANKVVIFCGGPINTVDTDAFELSVNGLQFDNKFFNSSSIVKGFKLNPDQTKAEAVTGTVDGVSNVPSISLYSGAFAEAVPVDIRATYDRNFPVYGFPGCAYAVFRLIDSEKFPSFNVIATIKGRYCRTFDEDGFITNQVTESSMTDENGDFVVPDGVQTRFIVGASSIYGVSGAIGDVISIDSLAVTTPSSTTYTLMSPSNQTGNVFWLNREKGYIEFLTAPPSGSNIVITYTYYIREWTANPAAHVIYLLTEKVRGKGVDESEIDWASAVDFYDFCADQITYVTTEGTVTRTRYESNYSIDLRRPIQEHMRVVLDAAYANLFQSGGKWVVRARKSGASVFSFDTSNILPNGLKFQTRPRGDRANVVKLLIHTADSLNSETEVKKENSTDQADRVDKFGNAGIVTEQLKMPAVNSYAQGELLAENLLKYEVESKQIGEIHTNIKGLALQPEDIVDVTHPARPLWAGKLVRVEDIDHDPEQRLIVRFSEYVEPAIE